MPKKTIGKYDRKSPRIGFHKWNLEAITEGAPELLNKAFKEALDIATTEYKVSAEFTYNTEHEDPATIEVGLPLGPGEHEHPTWEFRLSELVENRIFYSDPEDAPQLVALRDRLRELVDTLDKAISNFDRPAA